MKLTPVDWSIAHTTVTSPTCQAFVEAENGAFHVVLNHGSHLFVCFPVGTRADLSKPVPPPPGTPGT